MVWDGMGIKINKSFYTRQKNPGATKMLLAMLFESSNGIVRVGRERFVERSRDARERGLRLRFQSNIYREL
jgi:hypothetical protein